MQEEDDPKRIRGKEENCGRAKKEGHAFMWRRERGLHGQSTEEKELDVGQEERKRRAVKPRGKFERTGSRGLNQD